MASIILLAGIHTTAFQAVGTTLSVSFSEARRLISLQAARWASADHVQEFTSVDKATILSLTGDGLASLDSILLRTAPLNAVLEVFLTVDAGSPRRYQVRAKGALTAEGDAIISPPDYDATANDKFLVQC